MEEKNEIRIAEEMDDELVFEDLDLEDLDVEEGNEKNGDEADGAEEASVLSGETSPEEETVSAEEAAPAEEEAYYDEPVPVEELHFPKWLAPAAIAAVLAVAAGAYAFTAGKYRTRFFPNTTINGVDVSELTAAETEELLNREAAEYSLTVSARNC